VVINQIFRRRSRKFKSNWHARCIH